ncbi:tetratricopeptide repeat protein 9C [Patella vulgata]|uniref:tetratricopeptide repeat protein 9C n=1 Tax=Patella vulgata TaxID=6465 RepID=UPI00217F658E|nr:tetratricopeptide repeat protein 9C [Patella vulgata]
MENGAMAFPSTDKISDQQRIENAKQYKNEGNKMHKGGNWRQAIGKYHRALLQVKGIGQSKSDILSHLSGEPNEGNDIPEEMKLQIRKIQLDCYNNLAASLMKQESSNYDKINEYCDKVLEIEPFNEKALYRKATALNTLRRFDETVNLIETFAKDIPALRKPFASAREGQKSQENVLKKNLQGMYDSKK